MTITFHVEAEDIAYGSRVIFRRTPMGKAAGVLAGLSVAALPILVALGLAGALSRMALHVIVPAALMAPLFWHVMLPREFLKHARSRLKSMPASQGEHTYTVNADGFASSGPLNSGCVQWDAFPEAVEAPEAFILYYARNNAYVIPKRFLTDAQQEELRAVLREHLGQRAKPA